MRFIHIADVHLGAQPDAGPLYSENRGRELWDTFEYVLGVCEDERTDLLLIAGSSAPAQRAERGGLSFFEAVSHEGGAYSGKSRLYPPGFLLSDVRVERQCVSAFWECYGIC